MLKKLHSKCFFLFLKYLKYPLIKLKLGDNDAMKLEIMRLFCLSSDLSNVYACTLDSLNFEKHKLISQRYTLQHQFREVTHPYFCVVCSSKVFSWTVAGSFVFCFMIMHLHCYIFCESTISKVLVILIILLLVWLLLPWRLQVLLLLLQLLILLIWLLLQVLRWLCL